MRKISRSTSILRQRELATQVEASREALRPLSVNCVVFVCSKMNKGLERGLASFGRVCSKRNQGLERGLTSFQAPSERTLCVFYRDEGG